MALFAFNIEKFFESVILSPEPLNSLLEKEMDHTEFKQSLSRLKELSPAQKRKLSDVLRVKDEGEAVAETLEKRISGGGHCPHCKHNQFQRWGISHGMQRYHCKNCLKTFNAATGTPARLRKKRSGWSIPRRWLTA